MLLKARQNIVLSHPQIVNNNSLFQFYIYQGSGAWPYTGLRLPKVKESLILIQMVQTLYTSANILHVCIHKNMPTMFQQNVILVSQQ